MVKISCVMTTYNGGAFLSRQLESIAKQTVLPHELIICDDDSSDNTLEIALSFKAMVGNQFNIVVVRSISNQGHVAGFSKAIGLVTGDYVALCDQDDVWYDNKLETFLKTLKKEPTIMAFMHDALLVDEFENTNNYSKIGQLMAAGLSLDDYWMGCASIVEASYVKTLLPIPVGVISHDVYILEPLRALNQIHIDTTVLMKYRRHSRNLSLGLADSSQVHRKVSKFRNTLMRILEARRGERHKARLLEDIQAVEATLPRYLEFQANLAAKEQKDQFAEYIAEKKLYLEIQKCRLEIANKTFFCRLMPTFSMLTTGGYARVNGIMSMVRDLFS